MVLPSIQANQLFQGLSEDVVSKAAQHLRTVLYPAGEVIFEQGDAGNCLYLVLAGTVRISIKGREGRQETLIVIGEGDFFGEMALIDRSPRSATATAVEPCMLAALDLSGLNALMSVAPADLSMNFIHAIISRLRRSNAHFIEEMLRGERLSMVGRMSGSIVHDFKNPMATISVACQMIERKVKDPQVTKCVDIIERSVSQMVGMTQELLEFSRGETQLHAEDVSVMSIINDLEEQNFSRLAQRNIKIERSITYVGYMHVDAGRFVRVLQNLVKNSMEAMPHGGTLKFGLRREGETLIWEVADTGCGIPAEVLAKVFEPFVTHGKSGGTGLGMTIAKTVAEAHGGSIAVESTVGVGTKTTVRIPLVLPSRKAPMESPTT
ncbi:MAG: cyclic nucleotide-binding domain-containing protein [Verrucomicrobia bacterium]|nr:cyclic nucleotide-binding domain-containing protein [Verrucomicrobiota bacterium]